MNSRENLIQRTVQCKDFGTEEILPTEDKNNRGLYHIIQETTMQTEDKHNTRGQPVYQFTSIVPEVYKTEDNIG